MSYIQLLTFSLWCMYLLFIAFEGEDNKSKRALGREGSSMQRQVKRTDLDDQRPVHLTRVREPWDNTGWGRRLKEREDVFLQNLAKVLLSLCLFSFLCTLYWQYFPYRVWCVHELICSYSGSNFISISQDFVATTQCWQFLFLEFVNEILLDQVNLLFGLSAALSVFVDTDFVVCLMAHYFTGFLNICSPIQMNRLFYVHTGYLSYM